MTINYTTLLGLAKPVTGTESGEWGDVVNDQITSLVEDAIANAASISVTAGNVTLTDNNGTSDQARMAILLVTGSPGVSRNIVAPSTSKWYIVKNGSNAEVVLKGSATTGVTIPAGAEVLAFWNGSDFEVTSMVGPSTSTDNAVARFDGTTGKVVQNSSVVIDDSNNITGIVDETLSGNLNFTGTAKRITGDFSNTTIASRVIFQTSTTNGATSVSAIPNGSATGANFAVWNTTDTANGAVGIFDINSSALIISATKTGTGSFLPIVLETNSSERMRIDTSGNVGIGTTSPDSPLTVKTDTDFVVSTRTTAASTGARIVALNAAQNAYKDLVIDGSQLIYAISGTERMRIDTSGDVLIATTGSLAGAGFIFDADGFLSQGRPSGAAQSMVLYYNGGNIVGEIRTSTTATQYLTTSDYRLKHAIQPMTNALTKVAALKPCVYKWKSNNSFGEGFIAHELAEVVPNAVAGEKDAVNEDGSIKSQSIDTSFLVATLTAAIQEQQAIIESLTARIAALESKGA